eukprot:Rhum_TRINITY_DN14889_c3_g1::Rhum_TRINITY_DN14889_c3_g1_i1::g.126382::m.126382
MTNKILLARDTGFRLKHVRNYSPQRPHGDERPSKVRRIDPACLRRNVVPSAPATQQLSPECCPMSLDRSSPPSVQRGASDTPSPACDTPVRRLSFGIDDRGEGFSFGSPAVRADRRNSAGSACSASPDTLAAEARRPNRGTAYGTVSALLDHANVRRRRARRRLQLSITTPTAAACGGAPELPPPTPLRCALKGYDFGALRKPRTAAAAAAGPSLLSAPFQPRHSVAPPSLPAAARPTAHAVVAARVSAPAAAPSTAAHKPKAAATAVAPAPAHAAQHTKKTAAPSTAVSVPPAEATAAAAAAAPCVETGAGGAAKERRSVHHPHHHHRPVHRHNHSHSHSHSHPPPADAAAEAEVVMGPVWQRPGVLPPDAVRAPVPTVPKKQDAAEKMPHPPAAAAAAAAPVAPAPKAPLARKRPSPVQQDGADTVSERRQARAGRANHFAVYREEQRKAAAAASRPSAHHAGSTARRRSASQKVYGTGEVEAAAPAPAASAVVPEAKEQRVPFAPLTNVHHHAEQQQGPKAQSAWGQGVYKNGSDRERAQRVMEMKRIAAERSRQRTRTLNARARSASAAGERPRWNL